MGKGPIFPTERPTGGGYTLPIQESVSGVDFIETYAESSNIDPSTLSFDLAPSTDEDKHTPQTPLN